MNNSRSLHSMVFSLIAALLYMILSIVISMTSENPQNAWNYLAFLFIFGALLFGQILWRDKGMGGFMTYGQAFKYVLLFSLWYAIFTAIWTVIFMSLVAPDMVDKMLEVSRQEMERQHIPEEQIEMGIEMSRKFMHPAIMAVFALIINFIYGIVVGLITSIFSKKDKPFQPFQLPNQ